MKYTDLISQMTLEEKCSLLSGNTQFTTKAVDRLGIPSVHLADGPHGLRKQTGSSDNLGLNPSEPATCFPTAVTVASSWDTTLGETLGALLAEEALSMKVSMILGPGLNMKRDPLCGRNFEYFSEDPILAGKMAAAYIRGIQAMGVSACPKHFAVNSQETFRMHSNAVVDERTLREVYLTGFEIAVKEGKPQCIMSSYNRVNGVYASENAHLLQEILRDDWGFDGISVTDWGASNDRVEGLKAGTHLEMPTSGGDSDRELAQAVREGRLSEAVLDQRLDEYLTVLFDIALPEDTPSYFDADEHHAFAEKVAAESMVLMKNEDHILPLAPGTKVALIGDFAQTPRYQGAGSSCVNVTRLDCLKDAMTHSGLELVGYAPGFDRLGSDDSAKLVEAPSLAKQADAVILCLGLPENRETEGMDRPDMVLPENQVAALQALCGVNPNIIVTLSTGAPVETAWIACCKALVNGYLSGQAGAGAMADVLTGKVNPSGKLAESWPIRYADTPTYGHYPAPEAAALHREGPFIGYRYYDTADIPVAFPFGFGLSYTTFQYSDLALHPQEVTFTLTNTGTVPGAEVAQVYIGKKDSTIFRPIRELKGFAKVFLHPGESITVTISLDDKAFRYWNVKTNRWEIEPGTYQISVGASSRQLLLCGEIQLQGTDAPDPYRGLALPSYRSGKILQVPDEEFSSLLGHPVPAEYWDRSKALDINDTFAQLSYARGCAGRLTYRIIKGNMDKALQRDAAAPDLTALFIYNMPLRGIGKLTAGMLSLDMAKALLELFNGHFFRGCGHLISAAVRKKKGARKTKAALQEAAEKSEYLL